METENIILTKTYSFAVKIVSTYKHLKSESKEFVLSKQLLRSGTSIGANVEEAVGGISKKDFIAKMSISYKEARETKYWLRLLHNTDFLDNDKYLSMTNDCEEILRLLYSIIKSSKENS